MSLPCITGRVLLFITCTICSYGQSPFDLDHNSDRATRNPSDPLGDPPDGDLADRPRTVFERVQRTLASAPNFPSDREIRAAPGTVSVAELRNGPPKTELSLMQQAQRFANAGDHSSAIQVLKRGLADESSMPHVRGLLAVEYLKTGNMRAAIPELKLAIEAAPSVAANYSNLGYALCRIGDTEHAETQVREAIRLDRKLWKSHFLLGLILLNRGDPEARDELLLAQNELSAARLALAVYHVRYGQTEEAERQIQAFLRMSPSADPGGTEIWVATTAALERPASAFGFPASQDQ
jgi:Tfp pilus assembly protein PilF